VDKLPIGNTRNLEAVDLLIRKEPHIADARHPTPNRCWPLLIRGEHPQPVLAGTGHSRRQNRPPSVEAIRS
jgi:hypothetical protein